ncbi:MAG: YcnI family protein [Arthrobacter sp.]
MTTARTRTAETIAALTAAAGLLLAGAGAASAHVRVDPSSPSAGGYSQLTFKVPNESATAKTTRIAVALPTGTPFTSVSVKPMEGWTAEITEATLPSPVTVEGATVTRAPSAVTWTADEAHQLGQHEYQTFSISVGRLPAAGTTVELPATQWYSDGTVVKWDEPAGPGHAEPEHPAPAFVTTADEGEHGQTALAGAAPVSATTPASDNTVGLVGLGAGILGLAAGAAALVRTRAPRKR